MSFFIIFLMFVWCIEAFLDYSNIEVAIAMDGDNPEIVYEGLRLINSIRLFGGRLNETVISLCISTKHNSIDENLRISLMQMNIDAWKISPRFELPSFSPTLNKLCALESVEDDIGYLLYLDADTFISRDPIPDFERILMIQPADIYCGRPWDTFPGIDTFENYLDDNHSRFIIMDPLPGHELDNMLPTIAGGMTFYGMCNTGVYFMRRNIARQLLLRSRQYLQKSIDSEEFRNSPPYAPYYFGIDSVILWAAQHSLGFTVAILPLRLNYIAPAESYLQQFMQAEHDGASGGGNSRDTTAGACLAWNSAIHTDTDTGEIVAGLSSSEGPEHHDKKPIYSPLHSVPAITHFSRGSSLLFERQHKHVHGISTNTDRADVQSDGDDDALSDVCVVRMRADFMSRSDSPMRLFAQQIFGNDDKLNRMCWTFLRVLEQWQYS